MTTLTSVPNSTDAFSSSDITTPSSIAIPRAGNIETPSSIVIPRAGNIERNTSRRRKVHKESIIVIDDGNDNDDDRQHSLFPRESVVVAKTPVRSSTAKRHREEVVLFNGSVKKLCKTRLGTDQVHDTKDVSSILLETPLVTPSHPIILTSLPSAVVSENPKLTKSSNCIVSPNEIVDDNAKSPNPHVTLLRPPPSIAPISSHPQTSGALETASALVSSTVSANQHLTINNNITLLRNEDNIHDSAELINDIVHPHKHQRTNIKLLFPETRICPSSTRKLRLRSTYEPLQFQLDCVEKCVKLARENGHGHIIADEQGLGKTVTMCIIIQRILADKPARFTQKYNFTDTSAPAIPLSRALGLSGNSSSNIDNKEYNRKFDDDRNNGNGNSIDSLDVLILVPTTALLQWPRIIDEIFENGKELTLVVSRKLESAQPMYQDRHKRILLTTHTLYATIMKNRGSWVDRKWSIVVLDEAHVISSDYRTLISSRSHQSKSIVKEKKHVQNVSLKTNRVNDALNLANKALTSKSMDNSPISGGLVLGRALDKTRADYKYALTGTPQQNSELEWAPLFRFVYANTSYESADPKFWVSSTLKQKLSEIRKHVTRRTGKILQGTRLEIPKPIFLFPEIQLTPQQIRLMLDILAISPWRIGINTMEDERIYGEKTEILTMMIQMMFVCVSPYLYNPRFEDPSTHRLPPLEMPSPSAGASHLVDTPIVSKSTTSDISTMSNTMSVIARPPDHNTILSTTQTMITNKLPATVPAVMITPETKYQSSPKIQHLFHVIDNHVLDADGKQIHPIVVFSTFVSVLRFTADLIDYYFCLDSDKETIDKVDGDIESKDDLRRYLKRSPPSESKVPIDHNDSSLRGEPGVRVRRSDSRFRGRRIPIYHGQLSERKRMALVKDFQAGRIPVLMVSLKAACTAIDLTRGTHVYFLTHWWNPFIEEQAAARLIRATQTKHVTVWRPEVGGTESIERLIRGCQTSKIDSTNQLLGENNRSSHYEKDEKKDVVSFIKTSAKWCLALESKYGSLYGSLKNKKSIVDEMPVRSTVPPSNTTPLMDTSPPRDIISCFPSPNVEFSHSDAITIKDNDTSKPIFGFDVAPSIGVAPNIGQTSTYKRDEDALEDDGVKVHRRRQRMDDSSDLPATSLKRVKIEPASPRKTQQYMVSSVCLNTANSGSASDMTFSRAEIEEKKQNYLPDDLVIYCLSRNIWPPDRDITAEFYEQKHKTSRASKILSPVATGRASEILCPVSVFCGSATTAATAASAATAATAAIVIATDSTMSTPQSSYSIVCDVPEPEPARRSSSATFLCHDTDSKMKRLSKGNTPSFASFRRVRITQPRMASTTTITDKHITATSPVTRSPHDFASAAISTPINGSLCSLRSRSTNEERIIPVSLMTSHHHNPMTSRVCEMCGNVNLNSSTTKCSWCNFS